MISIRLPSALVRIGPKLHRYECIWAQHSLRHQSLLHMCLPWT